MEVLNEIKTNEMTVRIQGIENPFRCKIIETSNEELPFHYDAEYISEREAIRCRTYGEAFINLTKYIGNLVEPLQTNENY